ncbi:hypothetical protein IT570_12720 [Candidatus Sumerlaeota bacterium]|nr:hypothetical protein [Candidatus Sumerlaeota bacterium]
MISSHPSNKILPAILACLVSLLGTVRADKITLSNGRVIEGRVVAREGDRVVVESGGMVTRLSASSVVSVQKVAEYLNVLRGAEESFRRRDVVGGIDKLKAALTEGASVQDARAVLDTAGPIIRSTVGAARDSEKISLRRALHDLVETDLLTTGTMIQTAQNLRALDDWDAAVELLDRMPPETLGEDPMTRAWSLEFMRTLVRRQLARGDFEGAIACVEKIRRISGDDSSPEIPLAHLTRAAAARDRNDYTLALGIIARDLASQVPEIARNRALFTIEEMKAWAQKNRKFREAREALLPIQRVFPVEAAAAEQFLMAGEVEDDLNHDDSAAALELADSIPEEQREPKLQKLRNEAFHAEAMKRLADEREPLALLNHGRWCAENGLLDEAMLIFNRTRDNPNLRDVSDEALTNTRRERDTKLLEEAQEFMKLGNIAEVTARTQVILTNPNLGSSLTEEAQKLEALAKASSRRDAEARPYQAEVIFQQAERDYFQQNFEGALKYVSLILNDFADTPAAGRATSLLPEIVRALELAYLEGKISTLPKLPPKFSFDKVQRTDRLGEEVTRLLDSINKN